MADIPHWFSLERYKVAEKFTSGIWLENLRWRKIHLMPHTPEPVVPYKGRYQDEPPKLITKEWRSGRQTDSRAVWPLLRLDAYISAVNDDYHAEIIKSLGGNRSYPVQIDEVKKYEWTPPVDYSKMNLSPDGIEKLKSLLGKEFYHGEHWRLTESFESPFSGDIESISVWLEQPDALIIEDFKEWLVERRKRKPLKKGKKDVKIFKKWCVYQILAFLDLQIWANFEEVDLPYHKIGEAIFPDDIDVDTTERIRKVVKPLADQAIDEETLAWLQCCKRNNSSQ